MGRDVPLCSQSRYVEVEGRADATRANSQRQWNSGKKRRPASSPTKPSTIWQRNPYSRGRTLPRPSPRTLRSPVVEVTAFSSNRIPLLAIRWLPSLQVGSGESIHGDGEVPLPLPFPTPNQPQIPDP